MILIDLAPDPTGVGIGLGLAAFFFLICGVVAFIAFKMLKRTVKMAVRMTIVAVILLVALIGGVALIWFTSGSGSAPTRRVPPPTKTTK